MFILTVLIYPALLALLCVGAGLLVDRVSAGVVAGALLPVAGLAALIALTQLCVYSVALAPITPYLLGALAAAGLVSGRRRAVGLLDAVRSRRSAQAQLGVAALAYLLAIAPVLLSGRASLSSFMTLTDSAAHIVGAGYLIGHGQSFAHLDLHNSYGLIVSSYFNTGYPSGADTLFGASALLPGLPLIWAFQPFNAFVLATAVGPAWMIARRIGLDGWWAALAALTATLPALVYAYDLIASVKEVTTLPLLLAAGALVATHKDWLARGARAAVPFAALTAAAVSSIGVGFGVWALASTVVLAAVIAGQTRRGGSMTPRAVLLLLASGALTLAICALPTWARFQGSVQVATAIAKTSNPGNLQTPLRPEQVLGTWLSPSYLNAPLGGDLTLTRILIALSAVAAALGAVELLRRRRWALASWFACMLVVWLGLTEYGTTWVDAKGLVLTSPVVLLLAWAGVQCLRSVRLGRARPRPISMRPLAAMVAAAIAAGVLVSDAMQYHASDLAPTARYEELAALNSRFAGRGPTLFTDFDEYAIYALRSLDVGGPDFLYPPPALASTSEGHGHGVYIERAKPSALLAYPLIVTRRNPAAPRPPAAYRLLWRGRYYEAWGRRRDAPAAVAVDPEPRPRSVGCRRIAGVAAIASSHDAKLVADLGPKLISMRLLSSQHPSSWERSGPELVLSSPGRLRMRFFAGSGGRYQLWLRGEVMPTTYVRVDGRRAGTVSGEVAGNGDSPDTIGPIAVSLKQGGNELEVERGGFSLAPGNGAHTYLDRAFFVPDGASGGQRLLSVPASRWHSLCARRLEWVEAIPMHAAGPRRR